MTICTRIYIVLIMIVIDSMEIMSIVNFFELSPIRDIMFISMMLDVESQ